MKNGTVVVFKISVAREPSCSLNRVSLLFLARHGEQRTGFTFYDGRKRDNHSHSNRTNELKHISKLQVARTPRRTSAKTAHARLVFFERNSDELFHGYRSRPYHTIGGYDSSSDLETTSGKQH
jgi:hypothetical protein